MQLIIMYSEKTSIIIASAVALLVIFAVGAGSITGGISGNVAGGLTGTAGIAIVIVVLIVFLLAAVSVLKTLVPEGGFHQ